CRSWPSISTRSMSRRPARSRSPTSRISSSSAAKRCWPRQPRPQSDGSWPTSVFETVEVAADRAQIGDQTALGGLAEALAGRLEARAAIGPEVAEVAAQPAPRSERPGSAPERQAQRLDVTLAGTAAFVLIVEPQHAVSGDRGMQPVDDAAR